LTIVAKWLQTLIFRESVKFQNLVPGFVAANDFNPAAGAIQLFPEQFDQRLIRRRVHRQRGDFDFQFIAGRGADFIFGGARLEFHQKQSAAGRCVQKVAGDT
jgi:hypothetical protein